MSLLTRTPRSPAVRRAGMRVRADARAPWAWGLSGVLLGAVLSVLLFAPARWLAAAVREASDGQVLLQDTRGTVWSGSAQLTLSGGAGSLASASLPSRLSWQVQPGLTGLGVRLEASCCLVQPWQFWLAPAWSGATLRVSDSPSAWPAEILMGLGTPFNTIAPQGQLALTTRGLVLAWVAGRLQVTGQAQLDAQDISSRLSTLRPMGSYRFTLAGGTAPELLLSTLRGSLLLSGRGQWVGGKLRFVGEASSASEHQAALSNLLNIIGRRNGARSIIKLG